MKSGISKGKYFIPLVAIVSVLANVVTGNIGSPPLFPIEGNDEFVEISGSTVTVVEEKPKTGEGPFRIGRINHNENPNDIIITEEVPYGMQIEVVGDEAYLVLTSKLDYETKTSFSMILRGGNAVPLRLFVRDINDNPPEFTDLETEIEVLEDQNKEGPQLLHTFTASDPDEIDRGRLRFFLTGGVPSGVASKYILDPESGELTVKARDDGGRLDYLESPMHRFDIYVNDSGEPPERNDIRKIFTISIKDVPDLPPAWTSSFRPLITVNEGPVPSNPVIQKIEAKDGDIQVKCDLTYKIEFENSNMTQYFELVLDGDSWELSVVKPINASEIVKQNGGLIIDATVTVDEINNRIDWPDWTKYPNLSLSDPPLQITVIDDNDCYPEFCLTAECTAPFVLDIDVNENTIGTLHDSFIIQDCDPTSRFSTFNVTLVAASADLQYVVEALSINPSRGISQGEFSISAKNANALDYEADLDPKKENEGKWWYSDENGVRTPKSVTFKIVATDSYNASIFVEREVTLTVKDLNDNEPSHRIPKEDEGVEEMYTFAICEDVANNIDLMTIDLNNNFDPAFPVCKDNTGELARIEADDADISSEFGQESIIFEWSNSKKPPLELNRANGQMKVRYPAEGASEAFNFERFTEEFFTVIAKDNLGNPPYQSSNAVVKLVILDVNDTPVDLKVNVSRITIQENNKDVTFSVEIIAEDVDLQASITFDDIKVDSTTNHTELDAQIAKWFKIGEIEGEGTNKSSTRIVINKDSLPDREGCDLGSYETPCPEVDRVDIIITARDTTTKHGEETAISKLTIEIEDKNDNYPQFTDIPEVIQYAENICDENEVKYKETITMTLASHTRRINLPPKCATDNATDYEREIASFRVTDRDRNSKFTFNIRSNVEGMVDLVELYPRAGEETTNGRVILRRKKEMIIDREFQDFYDGDTDTLQYVLTVSDGINTNSTDVIVNIVDINDNTPEFVTEKTEYEIIEGEGGVVQTFLATDKDKPDRYGDVSYKRVPTVTNAPGEDEFEMGLKSGILTVKESATAWDREPLYQLRILAIDNYRESSESLSNTGTIAISVTIIDINDHPPVFVTEDDILDTVKETEVVERFPNPFEVADKDDFALGNGDFEVILTNVTCSNTKVTDPKSFFEKDLIVDDASRYSSRKKLYIKPAKSFADNWGEYTLTFEAKDKPKEDQPSYREPLESGPKSYKIVIANENRYAPEFKYPDPDGGTPKKFVSTLSEPNEHLGIFIETYDRDDPSVGNGKVSLSLDDNVEEVTSIFKVVQISAHNFSLQITEYLPHDSTKSYMIILTARDAGEPVPRSNTATIEIQLTPSSKTPPMFREDVPRPFPMTIKENEIASERLPIAYDLDIEAGDEEEIIYYHIVEPRPPSKEYFRILNSKSEEGEFIGELETIATLDREIIDSHDVLVFVSNGPEFEPPASVDPDNLSYLPVKITVEDVKDVAPVFVIRGLISAGISVATVSDVLTLEATDDDFEDVLSFEIVPPINTSDISLDTSADAPFVLDRTSGNLALSSTFRPTPSMQGYFSFIVKVSDSVFMSSTATCRIYVINEEDNIVKFVFQNKKEELEGKKDILDDILSELFGYDCHIRNIVPGFRQRQSGGVAEIVTVETYFIDHDENLPVLKRIIENNQFNAAFNRLLDDKLKEVEINYDGMDDGDVNNEAKADNLITYFLVAGIAILGVILAISSVMWFFNNRGLSRRVRALNATAFGSQQSGLNRAGATTLELPNTNAHAIEGSNPIWTTQGERKIPEFDTESVGSGGSVLIGAEDEDYFRNYKGTDIGGMGMSNPLFNMNIDDGENDFGNAMYSDNEDDGDGDDNPPPYHPEFSYQENDDDNEEDNNIDHLDIPMPAVSRRNPLMNMDIDINMDDSDG